MESGTIKNLSPHHNYSAIPTDVMTSKKLSASAKGMLAFLLSLPPNHNINKQDLPEYFKEGYFALNTAFEELVKMRFIHRVSLRNKKGHYMGYEYRIFNAPTRKTETQKTLPSRRNRKTVEQQTVDKLINRIHCENCLDTMSRMPSNFIDLVVTSPPYDQTRYYQGNHRFEFEKIAIELSRVLKAGGIIVWVIGDGVTRGSESGTAFKQALFFKENCGLRLHDTMIFEKAATTYPAPKNGVRYSQHFDYMLVFSKGKPKTVNLICDKLNKWHNTTNFGQKTDRNLHDELVPVNKFKPIPEFSPRTNIWKYNNLNGYSTEDKIAHEHPAIFPEKLAEDHILSWTNEGDLVYDCFSGSGTTLKMAKKLKRQFIGSEIVKEYFELIINRLRIPS